MSEMFLAESVALSSRNFYLIMIKSSIDFIINDGEKLLKTYQQTIERSLLKSEENSPMALIDQLEFQEAQNDVR